MKKSFVLSLLFFMPLSASLEHLNRVIRLNMENMQDEIDKIIHKEPKTIKDYQALYEIADDMLDNFGAFLNQPQTLNYQAIKRLAETKLLNKENGHKDYK